MYIFWKGTMITATNLEQLNRFGPRDPVFSDGVYRPQGSGDHLSFGIHDSYTDAARALKANNLGNAIGDIVEYWNLNELLHNEEIGKWFEQREAFDDPVITVQETV
jgi:hypothetical protein|tara:strand:- start:449 stop:766 length:318 start_codon:yes stop_codon:yes gene_type:complete